MRFDAIRATGAERNGANAGMGTSESHSSVEGSDLVRIATLLKLFAPLEQLSIG